MTDAPRPETELLAVAEAIMRLVDDFKTVAVNGYDDPGLRGLLLSATREVLASVPARGGEGEVRELRETITELQRDLCRYAGVSMPSERDAFNAVRAEALEDAAKVADAEVPDWETKHGNPAKRIAAAIRALTPPGPASSKSD